MLAHAAAAVVMVHHPLADPRFLFRHAAADGGDDAAGLVPGDGRIGAAADASRHAAARRGAISMQVAAAHARRLDLEHDLAGTRRRVREFYQFKFPVSGKDDTAHGAPPSRFVVLHL